MNSVEAVDPGTTVALTPTPTTTTTMDTRAIQAPGSSQGGSGSAEEITLPPLDLYLWPVDYWDGFYATTEKPTTTTSTSTTSTTTMLAIRIETLAPKEALAGLDSSSGGSGEDGSSDVEQDGTSSGEKGGGGSSSGDEGGGDGGGRNATTGDGVNATGAARFGEYRQAFSCTARMSVKTTTSLARSIQIWISDVAVGSFLLNSCYHEGYDHDVLRLYLSLCAVFVVASATKETTDCC